MEFSVILRREEELLIYRTPLGDRQYRVFQVHGQFQVLSLNPMEEPEQFSEVYVTNVPRNISVVTLFRFFVRCGDIYQIRLLMDFSGYNRGRCYVQYLTLRASREAICCLDDEKIEDDHRVCVNPSFDNTQLILKAIPEWISQPFLKHSVNNLMGEGLDELEIKSASLPNHYHGFLKYKDHRFAIMAYKKSWPSVQIAGMPIAVSWAIPKLLKYSKNLYFTNFSSKMTKWDLFQALCRVVNVQNMISFRIVNRHGYITFRNENVMNIARNLLTSFVVKDHELLFSETPFQDTFADNFHNKVSRNGEETAFPPNTRFVAQPGALPNPGLNQETLTKQRPSRHVNPFHGYHATGPTPAPAPSPVYRMDGPRFTFDGYHGAAPTPAPPPIYPINGPDFTLQPRDNNNPWNRPGQGLTR